MTESNKNKDEEYFFLLTMESIFYGRYGYAYRKGKTTTTFKNYLKRRGLRSLVEWIEKKEKEGW